MQQERANRIYFWMGIVLLLCGIAYLALDQYILQVYLPNSECIFYHVLGMYCPGCGGTRAVKAFFTGHFFQSLKYHLAVPITAILYLCFMGSHMIHFICPNVKAMRFREGYLWLVLFLVIANFILRNVLLLVFHIGI